MELVGSGYCSECGERKERLVETDGSTEYGAEPYKVCPTCLSKALAMFESCAQCEHLDKSRWDNGQCVTRNGNIEEYVTISSGYNPAELQCSYRPSRFKLKVEL